jgi:predicted DNA-binding transcriptional regulator AlpA
MLSGKYTDQIKVHGNTVWVDLALKNQIVDIAKQSENWLDFITGCNQCRFSIIANCNGTYSIADSADIVSRSLLNSIDVRKLLGNISRQSLWNLKTRKDFPDPAYSSNGIELWRKEDIEKYISEKK